ncbi:MULTISPECIES: substrate-binding domain-containing protein [Halomonadaceae]|jgi:molybdate transport repressor ModE-like protein|uniref:LysR family transcriptional regulator n=1 Tax=Vreelandella piezotolerans TaxID=2609667 RepID=A0ABQ6X940_9GAMM|nr:MULTISPECIES: substrate-binding domain-containing protein [Halomonas]KAE8437570.1 LysR family transcriptional regulator [Halomonas piezotolerans]QJA25552.1 helix-turn-helix transcriptional regulator [Halomonas piezotolerans]TNH18732.1 LysR family transcriptional regulator [Halomonas sp. BL6]BCB60168.1 formate dehydrogenase [Halomonas sp. A020]
MKKISVIPSWCFRDEAGHQLDVQLLRLLGAVYRRGKLTKAAAEVGVSYRHAWNLLRQGDDFFGVPLVELQRGRGAKLSLLGEKLLWAEQRAMARLGPQLESLGSELNLTIQQLCQGASSVLRLHASHGFAVELLPKHLEALPLDLQYCSPHESLAALERGACDVAGFHLPRGSVGERVRATYDGLLKPQQHRVIGFIARTQGLMVAPGNPLGIDAITSLNASGIRFVNRQRSSGTRSLLDCLLEESHVPSHQIRGFDIEEYTHSAVAAYVAAGMADVGFGVEAAAQKFGLDFLPLATEDYLLACHHRALKEPRVQLFLKTLRGTPFQEAVSQLPGYAPSRCGEVMSVDEVLDAIDPPS